MQSLHVVKEKIVPQTLPGSTDCPVLMKIDLFILHRPPQPLNKDVIIDPAPAIHADPHFRTLKKSRKVLRGKLHPPSVLKISGLEVQSALFKASVQNLGSSVLDSSQKKI